MGKLPEQFFINLAIVVLGIKRDWILLDDAELHRLKELWIHSAIVVLHTLACKHPSLVFMATILLLFASDLENGGCIIHIRWVDDL